MFFKEHLIKDYVGTGEILPAYPFPYKFCFGPLPPIMTYRNSLAIKENKTNKPSKEKTTHFPYFYFHIVGWVPRLLFLFASPKYSYFHIPHAKN